MQKNKWFQKMLAIMLVLTLSVGLIACGTPKEDTASKDTGKTETTDSGKKEDKVDTTPADTKTESGVLAGNTDVTAEDILARDYSEKIKISFAGIQVTDGLDYNAGSDYYSWWTDTFNVEWDVTSLTFENWVERMNIWINADDLPDWSVWNFNPGDAANYVDQELVKRLPDDWKEKYPNLAAAASCSEANPYYEDVYDGTYYLFRPVFANNFPADVMTGHTSVHLRKDWAEQAGYDLSSNLSDSLMSLEEMIAYCQAVKDAGIVEYPWYNTSSGLFQTMDMACEASGVAQSAYYKGADGQYHWGPAEAETGVKEAVRQIKQAYDAGLIYPEFYTLQDPDDLGHYQSGGDGALTVYQGIAAWYDRFEQNMQKDLGVSYWDVGASFVVTDNNGVAHGDPMTNYWACNIISPNIDDATLERLLSIWDYGCTEEGQLRIRLGVPGLDWDYNADGEIEMKLKEQGYASLEEKYVSQYPILGNMFILSDDYSFINPSITKVSRDKVTEMYKARAAVTSVRGEQPDWNLLSYSSQALNLASMTYADEYANIITKEGDFDVNYDAWVNEKMSMIQPVLDELNAAFGD